MTIKCHFDGKVFVPEEPVDLPVNQSVVVQLEPDPGYVIFPPKNGGNGTVGEIRELMASWHRSSDDQNAVK